MENILPDFLGKSVVFYVRNGSELTDWLTEGIVLESPTFQSINGRFFIVGQTPVSVEENFESDWGANRTAGLAWESVIYYIILPSQEYNELRKAEAKNED